jgi:hypothetical protein
MLEPNGKASTADGGLFGVSTLHDTGMGIFTSTGEVGFEAQPESIATVTMESMTFI